MTATLRETQPPTPLMACFALGPKRPLGHAKHTQRMGIVPLASLLLGAFIAVLPKASHVLSPPLSPNPLLSVAVPELHLSLT